MARRLSRALSAASVALAVWASAAAGQRTQYDALSFEPPKGWTTEPPRPGVRVYASPEGGAHRCQIALWESGESHGTVGADFEAEWKTLMQSEAKASMAEPSSGGDGWAVLSRTYHARDADGFEYEARFLTFSGHGRVTSVRIDMRQASCEPVVREFVSGLRGVGRSIASSASAPVEPSRATGVVGVWRAVGTVAELMAILNAPGTGFSMVTSSASLKTRTIAFLGDGSFTVSVPMDGLLDVARARQEGGSFWGTWSLVAGRESVRVGNAAPESISLDAKGALTYDRWVYHRVPTRATTALDGEYTAEPDAGVYMRSMTREPTIRFSADGRFEDRGALFYVRHVRGFNPDHQDDQPGSGRYVLTDYTLSLAYDDGRSIRILMLEPDATPGNRPRQLQLGGLRWVTRK